MKLLFRATLPATTLVRIGTAHAGDSKGSVPNTQFTEIPSVNAQAPVQGDHAYAVNQNGSRTSAYAIQQRLTVVFQ